MNLILDLDKNLKKGIIQTTPELLDIIRENFSQINKNFRFEKKRNPYAPQSKYIITPSGRFKLGIIYEIIQYVKNLNFNVNLTITTPLREIYNNILKYRDITELEELKIPLRYYQKESVLKCIQKGAGIIELGTAGGKTLIMASYIHNMFKIHKNPLKILIIAPFKQLVYQISDEFIEYGLNIETTKWVGKLKPDISKNIIIVNTDSILEHYKKCKWLNDIDIVIVDEVHKIKRGNEVNKLIDHIPTFNRIGFTGTLYPDIINRMNVIGQFGPVLTSKKAKQLRKEEFITNAEVINVCINYKAPPYFSQDPLNPTKAFNEEKKFLFYNEFRNKIIFKLLSGCKQNILILIDNLEYGEILLNLLSKIEDKKVFYIHGKVDVQERVKIIDTIEKSNNNIIIAISKIFSTGINIKNLHYIVFTLADTSEIKTVQTIGRGSRKLQNKDKLIIFDISDNTEYSNLHYSERLQIYHQEDLMVKENIIYER